MGRRDDAAVWATRVLAVALGLLTGADLLLGLSIVPFWKSLAPADFHAWFVAHGARLGDYLAPLGQVVAGLSVVTLALGWRVTSVRRGALVVITALYVGVLGVTLLGNFPINGVLASADPLGDADVTRLLLRWEGLHWVRTLLGAAAFAISIVAIRDARRMHASTHREVATSTHYLGGLK